MGQMVDQRVNGALEEMRREFRVERERLETKVGETVEMKVKEGLEEMKRELRVDQEKREKQEAERGDMVEQEVKGGLEEGRKQLEVEQEKRERLGTDVGEMVEVKVNGVLEEMRRERGAERERLGTEVGGIVDLKMEGAREEMMRELGAERERLQMEQGGIEELRVRLQEMEAKLRAEVKKREEAESECRTLRKRLVAEQDATGVVPAEGRERLVGEQDRTGVVPAARDPTTLTEGSDRRGLDRPRGELNKHGVEREVTERRVMVVGSSNISRWCVPGVKSRVGGQERVKVVACPGKCMSEVMESTKEMVWENQRGENLVIVHAGLNDVLRGRGHNVGRQIEAGVKKLREAAEKVHIVMCTIPEVQRQAKVIERAVVEANREIRQLGTRLGYQVMEVNREVYREDTAHPFDLGGATLRNADGVADWGTNGR